MKIRNARIDDGTSVTPGQIEGFTLGDLIAELQCLPNDTDLFIHAPTGDMRPGRVVSYRGYYEDLSIQPVDVSLAVTAGSYSKHLGQALGSVFDGYKGGRYAANVDSLIWVSQWGESSGARVIGVTSYDETAWILTAPMRWSRQ